MAHSRDPSLLDDPSANTAIDTLSHSSPDTAAHPPHSLHGVKKQTSLAHISVPSFRAFQQQASHISALSPNASTARLRPTQSSSFQPTHSPRPASFSLAEKPSPRLADPETRPLSIASPLPQAPSGLATELSPPLTEKRVSHTFDPSAPDHDRHGSIDSQFFGDQASSYYAPSHRSSFPVHERYAEDQHALHAPKHSISSIDFSDYGDESPAAKSEQRMSAHAQTPSMTLQLDGVQRTLSDSSLASDSSQTRQPRAKSPVGRLGNLFGWKSSSQPSGTDSPTTTFSERSHSPLPSPRIQKIEQGMLGEGSAPPPRLTPPGHESHAAGSRRSDYFDNAENPILLGSPETNAHVRELEKELAQVSAELAGSIRREMDLEDELERIRVEMPSIPPAEMTRRNSDYYSDSGASSARYPVSDPDKKLEELEQKLRKAEQDKANIKVEMASKLQTELGRRRDLEQMVHNLEEQLQKQFDEEDERGHSDARIAELEKSLEESKRRLGQERQAKDSFGDLYSATRLELEQHKNERDNLRDEVVPQLRARIEGLEHEAANAQALTYEHTRMQQELATLREEVQKQQAQGARGGFSSIAEEADVMSPIAGPRAGSSLSRSNSLARSRSTRGGSVTRSGSVKGEGRQRSGSVGPASHPVSVEGVKEIEDQRDALHKALKLMIARHEKGQREHERAIKKLRREKELAEQITPRRAGYHREVSHLKDEVTTLRKRTEDALEQKWQYEKGLSGIKIDLDRAEQETRHLRNMLQERDVLPDRTSFLSSLSSNSEEKPPADETMKLSISAAEGERDQARQIAQEYRQRAQSASSDASSEELLSSASRMDELADQLESQVQSNIQLRERLAEAVAKGEREQKQSTRQIEDMQKRLAGMEDSVLAAQQHSENTLGNHEAEVRRMDEASSPALQRLRIDIPEPHKLSPTSPLFSKSPRLGGGKTKRSEPSLLEASRTQMLERKVRELEGLLREAEDDMQTVVQRVNRSQLEVAELQTERDAALTQMRKLQDLIVEERERVENFA
ncbi:hypothetical protein KC356_g2819 [Hortaea werneckii]|nr:hypothetical protein KC356_g2819 [Hortaea werneckii]KAI7509081.1 hypothetical protein KC347_g5575 [Hortaea werneckii]